MAVFLLRRSCALGEPNATFNLGLTLIQLGRKEEGEALVREAAAHGDRIANDWLEANEKDEPGGVQSE